MSFESNEDRIGKLENQVAELIKIQRDMLAIFGGGSQPIFDLMQMIALVKEDHLSIMRFIAGQPVFGPAEERQKFMDSVARAETELDSLRAMLADKQSQLPPSPPSPAV